MNHVIFKAPTSFDSPYVNIGGGNHNLDANRCVTVPEGDYPGLYALGFTRLTQDEAAALPQSNTDQGTGDHDA